MSVLNDYEITERCSGSLPLISPFVAEKITGNGPSSGLSSSGYDCSLAPEFWLPKPYFPEGYVIDLKTITPADIKDLFDVHKADSLVLQPGQFILCRTVEWFNVPDDLVGRCMGKSTLRRFGFLNDITPLEPGWSGNLVGEINHTFPAPIRIHAGMGFCQIQFDELSGPAVLNYSARGGTYQGQSGITPGRIKVAK